MSTMPAEIQVSDFTILEPNPEAGNMLEIIDELGGGEQSRELFPGDQDYQFYADLFSGSISPARWQQLKDALWELRYPPVERVIST